MTFIARWPDGDFSIVAAADEQAAREKLNRVPAELHVLESCVLHFELADHGAFNLKQWDEGRLEVLEKAYPLLEGTVMSNEGDFFDLDPADIKDADLEILRYAVRSERERLSVPTPSA